MSFRWKILTCVLVVWTLKQNNKTHHQKQFLRQIKSKSRSLIVRNEKCVFYVIQLSKKNPVKIYLESEKRHLVYVLNSR